jgi:CHAD domain-containing protein
MAPIHTPITPDLPIAEAARLMMAEQLAIVDEHLPELRRCAEMTAVHETRKAIRRTFTLFKLFTPHFAPGALEPHRRALRRLMRRLAPCRDLAVFRQKLAAYNETAAAPLAALTAHFDQRQAEADERLRLYLERPKVRRQLKRYRRFTAKTGAGLLPDDDRAAPLLVRHVLPTIVFQRLGAVRAYGDVLPTATPAQFHRLRIQFKELRYTLTFFEDLLGETSGRIIEMTRVMQEHLGHLNDASVATALLIDTDCCAEEVAVYGDLQHTDLSALTETFFPLYAEFDRVDVRQVLALTVVSL